MALKLSEIRANVAARLVAVGEGLVVAPLPYELFARTPDQLLPSSFAVGLPAVDSLGNDRQRTADGVLSKADLRVAFAHKIRLKDKIESYDEGLETGRRMVKHLLERSNDPLWPGELRPVFRQLTGAVTETGEWFLGEVRLDVFFLLDLEG